MKPLTNHTLLYDSNCPLCAGYTQAFIKSGLLDKQGRMLYEEGIERYAGSVDRTKSRNEIALVNTTNGEVRYGVESLLFILASSSPVFKWVSGCSPAMAVLNKLYAFISFNRKVIATSANYTTQTCVPDFHISYRLLYLLVSGLLSSTVLLHYSHLLTAFVPVSTLGREYLICFGQLFFQTLLLLATKTNVPKLFDYLGNMMTVSVMGAILLLPVLLLNHYMIIPDLICLAYFFLVAAFMFLHHRRRIKNMAAPFWLSYTWVAYRLLVLLLIL